MSSASRSHTTPHGCQNAPTRFLPSGQVDAGLAADRRVDHPEQRGGDVHDGDAAVVAGGGEPGDVGDHAAADTDHDVVAGEAHAGEAAAQLADRLERLVLLAVRRSRNASCGMFASISSGTPCCVTIAARLAVAGINVPRNSAAPWPTSTSYDRPSIGTVNLAQLTHDPPFCRVEPGDDHFHADGSGHRVARNASALRTNSATESPPNLRCASLGEHERDHRLGDDAHRRDRRDVGAFLERHARLLRRGVDGLERRAVERGERLHRGTATSELAVGHAALEPTGECAEPRVALVFGSPTGSRRGPRCRAGRRPRNRHRSRRP